MTLDGFFMVSDEQKTAFINDNIVANVSEDERDSVRQRATQIVGNYVGRDADVLSVLGYAIQRGSFDEFAQKLEDNYRSDIMYVHPDARRSHPRIDDFFIECYTSLGIEKREQN